MPNALPHSHRPANGRRMLLACRADERKTLGSKSHRRPAIPTMCERRRARTRMEQRAADSAQPGYKQPSLVFHDALSVCAPSLRAPTMAVRWIMQPGSAKFFLLLALNHQVMRHGVSCWVLRVIYSDNSGRRGRGKRLLPPKVGEGNDSKTGPRKLFGPLAVCGGEAPLWSFTADTLRVRKSLRGPVLLSFPSPTSGENVFRALSFHCCPNK